MKRHVRLTPTESNLIENAVREAEARTSGEIVPVVVPSSSTYSYVIWLGSTLGGVLASVSWVLFHHWHLRTHWDAHPWTATPEWMALFQFLGVLAGGGVSSLPPIRRLLVPKYHMKEMVSTKARELFVNLGLAHTRDRTGVLVLVSVFERRVEILADAGIHQHVPEGFWDKEVGLLVASIHTGRFAEGMCSVVKDIGSKLEERFPKRSDDVNELPDRPVEL